MFVLALPPFWTGIWVQNEPASAGLHASAALIAVGLALGALAGEQRFGAACAQPVVLATLGLVLWGLLFLPFTPFPALAWLGSPELGEGLLYYLELAVLLVAAQVLRASRRGWRILAWAALSLALAATVPAFLGPRFQFLAPYYFPDYTAFFGLYAIGLGLAARHTERWYARVALVVGVAIIAASSNRTAVALTFGVGPIAWGLLHLRARAGGLTRRGVALAVCSAPLFFSAAQLVLPDSLLPTSVWSRAHLLRIVGAALGEHPWRLLGGFGWGHFGEALLAQAPLEGVSFVSGGAGQGWDALFRVDFHSHDFAAEALLAGGLPGMLLAIAIPALLATGATRHNRAVAGAYGFVFAALWSFWFQYPVSLAMMALAGAALLGPRPVPARRLAPPRRWRRPAIVFGLLLVASLTAQGAYATWHAARAARVALEDLAPVDSACGGDFPGDGRGGYHLAWALRNTLSRLPRIRDPSAKTVDRARRLLREVDCRVARGSSLRLAVSDLATRADVAFLPAFSVLGAARTTYLAAWKTRLAAVLIRAPARTDLAAPYLLWQLGNRDEPAVLRIARSILGRNPADPVGLWFAGIVEAGHADTARQGVARMRAALAAGVTRFVPIDDTIRRALAAPPRL